MGIRMLHHRTAPARASTDGRACVPLLPVPVFAPGASTARIPNPLATALRRTTAGFRRGLARRAPATAGPREAPAWRLWAELARGHLALALTLLPRTRRAQTFTVFVATADSLSARQSGPAPHRRLPGRRDPGPDAAS
ncbi:hypothetical protein GCM10010377_21030 [Streptomyces viridiviolaceus]|uniref:Uncharacterized protein n=1 Tax=Streptomyces viridiviolaceus TaxID=68282 RepID=A0ABW2DZH8_9ACTN|nr:hypothetical protein [Streptomyces viridiviolaceus]GHB30518.1 hypothetical protein GCM10010377_21030 [Streptomyces viridiviolaceus]